MDGEKINIVDIMKAGAELEGKIRSLGVADLVTHDEVAEYQSAVDMSRKGYVGEYFHQSINTLPPTMFQGLICRDENGSVIGTTAIRCDNISGWDLSRYIREYWSRAYRTTDGETVELSEEAVPFAKGITGPVAYIGDTFVDKAYNGSNLAAYIVRLSLLIASAKWQPNYIYGWMARHHAFKAALFLRWGYTTCYANGFIWKRPPENKAYADLCFLGCEPAGVIQLVRNPLDIGLDLE
ncbi:MAG: hypothetical protein ABJQ71_05690 [Roseibium sp.]